MAQGDVARRPDGEVEPLADAAAGWSAAIQAALPGAAAVNVHRVGRGATAETFAVEATAGDIVVKRYRRQRYNTVRLEWERLLFAQRVDVPVPRPLALDDEGHWFGVPALAMQRLPGDVDVNPRDVDAWLQQLGNALAAIHGTDTARADGPLLAPSAIQSWRPPALRRPSPLTDRALAAIKRHLPELVWEPVLTHCDFHPGNTLWQNGHLSGIVDWTEARLGPAMSDLAYCRADIALLLGQAAADRLTQHYAASASRTPDDLAVFDLIWGLDAHRKRARIHQAHRRQGSTASQHQFTTRTTTFLRHALAELAG